MPAPDTSSRFVWPAIAAATLVVIIGSVVALTRVGDGNSTSTLDPSSSEVDFPNLTSTFVSPTSGFSVRYFDRGEGTLTPAKVPWDASVEWDPNTRQADDAFDLVETGYGAVLKGASTEIPDGVSIGEWVDNRASPHGCGASRSQRAEITIDGEPGTLSECPNKIDATVVTGGRLYLFILLHSRSDARAVFDTFAATIELRPEAAAAP